MKDRLNDQKNHICDICFVSSISHTISTFYGSLLKQLKKRGKEFGVAASSSSDLLDIKKQYGCNVFPVFIARKITPLKDIIAIFRLMRYFRNQRCRIVHSHTPKGGLIGMIASFLVHVPVRIYTIHGLPLETATGLKRKLLWLAEMVSCRLANHILAVSPSLKDLVLKKKLCCPEKIEILGDGTACGINLKVFNPDGKTESVIMQIREELGISFDATVIGFVGRMVPDKGIDCLLKSFEIIQRQVDNIYLMIVGDYDNVRESVDDETREVIENNKQIIIVGFKNNVIPYYYAMDMLVLPSRREGFNYVLLEAAATGLSTVTTNATGCVDGVVDEETGFVVDIDDYEQFADRILRLIRSPEMRNVYGKKGLERVKSLFDSERLVEEHLKLYDVLREVTGL